MVNEHTRNGKMLHALLVEGSQAAVENVLIPLTRMWYSIWYHWHECEVAFDTIT